MTTKYRYDDELFDSLDEVSKYIQEMMNDNYEPYVIGEQEFYAGDILAKMDPIAFHSDCVSPFVEEEKWELIADDINGLAYQVAQAELVMQQELPEYYEQYKEMLAGYPDMDDIEKSDEIEQYTDGGITWVDGDVWRVTS